MLTPEYLQERIAYHGRAAQSHVLAHDRASQMKADTSAERHLAHAAAHAAIFNALTAIAAGK